MAEVWATCPAHGAVRVPCREAIITGDLRGQCFAIVPCTHQAHVIDVRVTPEHYLALAAGGAREAICAISEDADVWVALRTQQGG